MKTIMRREARTAVAGATLVALLSCGRPPTTPEEEGVTFLYVEGNSVVAPGESSPLMALEMRTGRDVSNVTASARWSAENPAIAVVQQTALRGMAPGSTTVRAEAGQAAGSADVHVVTPAAIPLRVSGRFTGNLVFTECTRLIGEGANLCRDRVGGIFPFELNISEQSGAGLQGFLKLMDSSSGPVRGYVDSDQRINLSGTLAIPGEKLALLVRRLELTLDGSRATGSARADYAVITGFGPQFVKQAFTIEASRVQ